MSCAGVFRLAGETQEVPSLVLNMGGLSWETSCELFICKFAIGEFAYLQGADLPPYSATLFLLPVNTSSALGVGWGAARQAGTRAVARGGETMTSSQTEGSTGSQFWGRGAGREAYTIGTY